MTPGAPAAWGRSAALPSQRRRLLPQRRRLQRGVVIVVAQDWVHVHEDDRQALEDLRRLEISLPLEYNEGAQGVAASFPSDAASFPSDAAPPAAESEVNAECINLRVAASVHAASMQREGPQLAM